MSKNMNIKNREAYENAVVRCREKGITIPTIAMQKNPELVPEDIKSKLQAIDITAIDPLNLYRITWKNDPETGLFNDGNIVEFPSELTGVDARIIGIVGKWFPTGSHKVGAAFGCLVPELVTGGFDPTTQKAVWPSTGNYCRGGAFDSALLGCESIAILPEEMSQERFDWLSKVASETIATPGCESNVKEIYDKCWEIKRTRPECKVFNQFEEWGNSRWHYHVTASIVEEQFNRLKKPGQRLSAWVSATGSAGTIAAGDYLKTIAPDIIVSASEALQCPTLLRCGFGGHRIEGIGDKHIPWIHNVRNTDLVTAIDDQVCMDLLRLFNEDVGHKALEKSGVPNDLINNLKLLGISSISNLLSAIKTAKWYEMDGRDIIFMPLTDSADLYKSRLVELEAKHGKYSNEDALRHIAANLQGCTTDNSRELSFHDRKQLHNFKYFTWVEQQQRDVEELRELWDRDFWPEMYAGAMEWDAAIEKFNADVKA